MTTQIITIDQTEFPVIVYKDLRVVTTELLAKAFNTDIKNIQKNFERNKGRFIEGKHFFKVVGEELKEFATVLKSVANFSKVRSLIIWTDRGAARHAKMLETDAAWDMFEKMEDCYFGTAQPQYGLKQFPEPSTITKAQQGILFNKVVDIAAGRGQIRTQIWSRFQNHFKLSSYKHLPADQFDDALAYLKAKQYEYSNGVEMMYVSNIELAALVDERIKSVQGELLGKETSPFMTDNAYRREAQKAFNDHFDSCHADMKQAGVTPPAWPVIDDKIIDGLAASMLWRTRWVMSFDNDQRMQLREMSNNDCVVDPRNSGQIESFINHLDLNMLHHVTDAIFARMIRQQDIAKKTNGTGKSQS